VARRDVADRPTRTLQVLLVSAFLVSIVHYVDNTVRYDEYAKDAGGPVTRPVVVIGWFVFTAFGIWGYLQYRQQHWRNAALGIAVYSASGLIGLAHYTAAPPGDFDAFQNVFIILDVALGLALMLFAFWLVLTRHSAPAAG
jgi:hypothetical protein